MEIMDAPLVSIAVIAYNSSKYIIETLEGIKSQTYPNIELIFSDDGSKDDTVSLYKEWIDNNLSRFVRSQLITVPKNTGTSANYNRAEDACQGDWVMTVDGDDVLLPNCITDYVEYIQEHSDAIYVFARIKAFGASNEECLHYEEVVFDPFFFQLSSEEQLNKLIFDRNYIPSAACFYNRHKKEELGIRNDERILLLEDYPKWINILKKGIRLDFMDKEVVLYRIGNGISTQRPSVKYWESWIKANILYCYPTWKEKDENYAADRLAQMSSNLYSELICSENQMDKLRNSKAYRLGRILLAPIKWLFGFERNVNKK